MSALCKDCSADTEPWPPRRGTQEHYIVNPEVWAAAGMPPSYVEDDLTVCGGGGFLCVGCIEKRLGQRLTLDDFPPATHYLLKESQNTARLMSRAGVPDILAALAAPLPLRVGENWAESTLRNLLRDHSPLGRGLEQVEIEGDKVALVYRKEMHLYRGGPSVAALIAALREGRHPGEAWRLELLPWDDKAA